MTRLIDADALKEAIAEFHQKENERLHNPLWGSIGLNALNRLIDNAPTVPLPDYKEGYKQAILDGKTNFSRPKGKWIEGYCNKCGVSSLCDGWGRDVESRFCPNCGADMREADNDN